MANIDQTASAVLNIRAAQRQDLVRVEQIVEQAYRLSREGWTGEADLVAGHRITVAELQQILQEGLTALLVAEVQYAASERLVVGCIQVGTEAPGIGHFGMLAVDPLCQAAGVGKRLLSAAEDHVRSMLGCFRMVAEVISVRTELLDWYQRRGYRVTDKLMPFVAPELAKVGGLMFVVIEKDL